MKVANVVNPRLREPERTEPSGTRGSRQTTTVLGIKSECPFNALQTEALSPWLNGLPPHWHSDDEHHGESWLESPLILRSLPPELSAMGQAV